jgi:hypothetical protein
MIDASEFVDHMSYCLSEPPIILPINNEIEIDLYRSGSPMVILYLA